MIQGVVAYSFPVAAAKAAVMEFPIMPILRASILIQTTEAPRSLLDTLVDISKEPGDEWSPWGGYPLVVLISSLETRLSDYFASTFIPPGSLGSPEYISTFGFAAFNGLFAASSAGLAHPLYRAYVQSVISKPEEGTLEAIASVYNREGILGFFKGFWLRFAGNFLSSGCFHLLLRLSIFSIPDQDRSLSLDAALVAFAYTALYVVEYPFIKLSNRQIAGREDGSVLSGFQTGNIKRSIAKLYEGFDSYIVLQIAQLIASGGCEEFFYFLSGFF